LICAGIENFARQQILAVDSRLINLVKLFMILKCRIWAKKKLIALHFADVPKTAVKGLQYVHTTFEMKIANYKTTLGSVYGISVLKKHHRRFKEDDRIAVGGGHYPANIVVAKKLFKGVVSFPKKRRIQK